MNTLIVTLPYPPSTNTAYATVRGRRVKTRKATEYAQAVQLKILTQPHWLTFHDLCTTHDTFTVTIHAHPPDKRKRDLANTEKLAVDAIFALLNADDSQITQLNMTKHEPIKNGKLIVTIERHS